MTSSVVVRAYPIACLPAARWCVGTIAAIIALSLSLGVARADEKDAAKSVFFSGSYEEAHAAVKDTERVLVLYFTATWCGPCKQMERTTWVDPRVVEQLTTKGLVYKIDVDKQRELSRKYGVRAMPTMIAMKGGEQVARVVGGRNPDAMLQWFEGVRTGQAPVEPPRRGNRRQPAERVEPGENDVMGRYQLAQQLMRDGEYAKALPHLEWLWDEGVKHQPSASAVRVSFWRSTIGELCAAHEPARVAFAARRDALHERLADPGAGAEVARDFAALNTALDEPERTLAWFDEHKDDPARVSQRSLLSVELLPLLYETNRWADAGGLLVRPVDLARQRLPRDVPNEAEQKRLGERNFARRLDRLAERYAKEHAALLAAGREDEANQMAMLVVAHLKIPGRVALVRAAVKAEQVRPLHRRLLAAIEVDQPNDYTELRDKVEAALRAAEAKE